MALSSHGVLDFSLTPPFSHHTPSGSVTCPWAMASYLSSVRNFERKGEGVEGDVYMVWKEGGQGTQSMKLLPIPGKLKDGMGLYKVP